MKKIIEKYLLTGFEDQIRKYMELEDAGLWGEAADVATAYDNAVRARGFKALKTEYGWVNAYDNRNKPQEFVSEWYIKDDEFYMSLYSGGSASVEVVTDLNFKIKKVVCNHEGPDPAEMAEARHWNNVATHYERFSY